MDGEFVKGACYPGLWVEGPLRGVCNDTWDGDDLRVGHDSGR